MALNATIDRASKTVFRAFKGVSVPVTLIANSPGDYDVATGDAAPASVETETRGIPIGYVKGHNRPLECAVLFERRVFDEALDDLIAKMLVAWPAVDDAERAVGPSLADNARFRPDSIDEGLADPKRVEWRVHEYQYGFGLVKIMFHTTVFQGDIE